MAQAVKAANAFLVCFFMVILLFNLILQSEHPAVPNVRFCQVLFVCWLHRANTTVEEIIRAALNNMM